MENALILTNGRLDTDDAKTAHGLIRGSSRFKIVGVIDPVNSGKDAGEVLDGRHRNIPVYASIAEYAEQTNQKPEFGIIGVALSGGKLPENWHNIILEAIDNRINIISTMHHPISDIPVLRDAARKNDVQITDLRKPKSTEQLHFWNGEIYQINTPKIAVLGMDCSIGKRTTCRLIEETCRKNGIRAEMIYTGQTGWLQGYKHGFIFDATLNDFVSGELEHAVVECARESSPDLILIEGQSGMRNPSGPCGSEIIVSANAKGIILQHAPFRTHYEELESLGCRLPDVADEIELIKMYGAKTLAVCLNGEGGSEEDLIRYQDELSQKLGLPVIRPLQDGVEGLLPVIRHFISQYSEK
jgi:uncharacterized NAD-dependent epimerase/dehydratase family protein